MKVAFIINDLHSLTLKKYRLFSKAYNRGYEVHTFNTNNLFGRVNCRTLELNSGQTNVTAATRLKIY